MPRSTSGPGRDEPDDSTSAKLCPEPEYVTTEAAALWPLGYVPTEYAARALGIKPDTLQKWAQKGDPRWSKLGAKKLAGSWTGRWWFPVDMLDQFLERAPRAMGLVRRGARGPQAPQSGGRARQKQVVVHPDA